jgi:hypothetical protein
MDCERLIEVESLGCSSWGGEHRRCRWRHDEPSLATFVPARHSGATLSTEHCDQGRIKETAHLRFIVNPTCLMILVVIDDLSWLLGFIVTTLDKNWPGCTWPAAQIRLSGSCHAAACLRLQNRLSRCASSYHPTLSLPEFLIVPGLNGLSGSTWKGAKLRIGEAKLGFRER